ncbi:MAG: PAS domain S-box protein [Gemmatimonadaceae bacterium]|jgi:PAS domain S-box-containing protein|nr:PAS domain S-box protein [Gemmatimonadaceae bacterium]
MSLPFDLRSIARAFDHVDGFGVVVLDIEGIVRAWNRGATRLFGHAPDAVVGQSIRLLYPADDATGDPVIERLRRAAQGPETVVYQGWRLRADGTRIWSEGDLSAVRDADGAVVGFIKTLHDRSEAYARDQQRAVASLVASQSHVGVVIVDAYRRIEWVNPAFEQLSGYTLAEVIGESPAMLHGRDTDPAIVEALWATLAAGEVFSGPLLCRRRDGTPFWVQLHIVPVRAAGGQIERFVAFEVDITLQQESERRLQEARERIAAAEHRLRTVVEAMADGLLVITADNTVTAANRAALAMLGAPSLALLQRQAVVGLPLRTADGTPVPAADQPHRIAMTTGVSITGETFRVTDDEGASRWVHVNAVPVDLGDDGAGAVVSLADVTEAQHAAELLREARDAAHAASRTKSDFLARMSHELRTPLNSIIGFSRLLLRNKHGALDATAIDRVERIERNGTQLLTLINDVLDLSKIEAGRMDVSWGPCDVRRFVADTVAELEGQLRSPHVALRLSMPATTLPLMTDAQRLRQVLVNLIGNALKFTERGHVEVRVCTDGTGAVTALEVHDTGIGIAPDRVGAIFESFEQADASHSRRFGGTGLGLAISRKLCTLLGARLEVTSTPGVGSCFRVVVAPASDRRAA